ncbi:hypothetical protein [Ralstonia pseudosolanacearum]|uniref:hypothetical protein n=1 Tax=Ralstonia pseudosolanacearum TaxID=1310165 RepID=UPI001FF80738|nr:hypothetical protein [Ralstonia pseudosolanacearum]
MVRIFRSNSTSTHAPPTSDGTSPAPAPESTSKTLPRSASFPMAALRKKAGRMLGLTSAPKAPKIEAPRAGSPSASPPRSVSQRSDASRSETLRSDSIRSVRPKSSDAPEWSAIRPGDKGRLVDLMHKERPSELTRNTRAAMGRKQVRFAEQATVGIDQDAPGRLSRFMGRSHRRTFSIDHRDAAFASGAEPPRLERPDTLRDAGNQRLIGIGKVVERLEKLIEGKRDGRATRAMVERGEIPYLVRTQDMVAQGLTDADVPDILARYREFNDPEVRHWLDSQRRPSAAAAADAESGAASDAESDAALEAAARARAESIMISDYEPQSDSESESGSDTHSEAGSAARTER